MKECERKAYRKKQSGTIECKMAQFSVEILNFLKCFSISFNIVIFENLANNVMFV